MTDNFSRLYNIERKTDVQISYENVMNSVSKRLWESCGHMTVYYMAITNYLYELSKTLDDKHYLVKDDLLMIIDSFRKGDDTPKEVKELCETMLKESNYNKKTPKFVLGDKFYIDYTEPTMDEDRIMHVKGNFYITKIDEISYKDRIYYHLSREYGGDKILVREDILEKSERFWR